MFLFCDVLSLQSFERLNSSSFILQSIRFAAAMVNTVIRLKNRTGLQTGRFLVFSRKPSDVRSDFLNLLKIWRQAYCGLVQTGSSKFCFLDQSVDDWSSLCFQTDSS